MKRRIFLALPVPVAVQKSLTFYKSSFHNPDFRWVRPENYHITISFFGEQEEQGIKRCTEAFSRIIPTLSAFTLLFDQVTLAPPKKHPTMLWSAYKSSPAFSQLVTIVEETASEYMSFPDKREGHLPIPHITLARFKAAMATTISPLHLDSLQVSECILYESRKDVEGYLYQTLQTFHFI